VEGSSALRLEARRGFSCSTMEELGSISNSKGFRSFREGTDFSFVWRNGNNFGRFLKVVVFAVGGQRGLLGQVEDFVKVVSTASVFRSSYGATNSAGKHIRVVSEKKSTVCLGEPVVKDSSEAIGFDIDTKYTDSHTVEGLRRMLG